MVFCRRVWYKHRDNLFLPTYSETLGLAAVRAFNTVAESVAFSIIVYFMCNYYRDAGKWRQKQQNCQDCGTPLHSWQTKCILLMLCNGNEHGAAGFRIAGQSVSSFANVSVLQVYLQSNRFTLAVSMALPPDAICTRATPTSW